jgi:2-hydroxy-6-oxonona-2,4-dienedioate hydrolase
MTRSSWHRSALIVAAIAVVGLGAPTCSRYRSSLDVARARVSTGSRIAASHCGPIEYAEMGAGPPVLLVHGAGGGFDQGLELGAGLARAGFRVIAPSRFGYLRTPLPRDASAAAQADAHACLLDALDVRRAAIMGISAGGPSALRFAARYPERTTALVLLVPAAYALASGEAFPRASPATTFLFATALRSDFLFWAVSKVGGRIVTRAILGTPPELVERATPEQQARVQAVLYDILPVSQRRAGLLNDARVVSSRAPYDLDRITAPTLSISAVDDQYRTFDVALYAAEHISGARFIGYPTGGHLLVGREAAVGTEIVGFLKTARPAGAPGRH